MSADLPAVARLFHALQAEHPETAFPLEPGEIARRFLPALDKDWQEAFIILDEEEEVLGLVVLGPEWQQDNESFLDIQGFLRVGEDNSRLAHLIAAGVQQRFQTYQAHHPRERIKLWPRDKSWFAYTPALVAALGLESDQSSLTAP
jgi:hypothetical protein